MRERPLGDHRPAPRGIRPGPPSTLAVVQLVDLPYVGPGDLAQIVDGEVDPYGTEHWAILWRDKSGFVGLKEDGRVIAQADWVSAEVRGADGALVEVVGLGGVLVHREYRGSGIGRQVVLGAMAKMRELNRPIAMLFCRPERVRFYESIGWFRIPSTVTADQPAGSIVMPCVACWAPLVEGAALPPRELHLQGLPF